MPNVRSKKKTSPETIAAKVKAAKALELRKLGMSFDAIAKEVGYKSKQSCFEAVQRAIKLIVREPAEEVIKIDLERLDAMWLGAYPNAISGDVQAINSCMQIMQRRARLLGLDAPAKQEVTGKDGKDLLPQSGVLMVPAAIDPASWEAAVAKQQAELQNRK